MFDLQTKRVYDWKTLFLLLSLGEVDPYLDVLGFPLTSQIGIIRHIAKSFVLALDSLEPNVFSRDEASPQTQALFAEIYRQLADALGEENTSFLLSWGGALLIDQKLDVSIFTHEDLLFQLDQKPDLTPPVLPDYQLVWLCSEIKQVRDNFRETGLAIDELDKLPRGEWETQAFSIYNMHENRELELSPYTELSLFIGFVRCCALLKKIEARFTSEELVSFENWFTLQPSWQESEARPAGYIHSYRLTELLKKF